MAVRTFLPARRIATLGLGLFCFAQSGLVSCTNVTRSGGLMLRIDRDPELEMDAVSVSVTTDTRVLETEQYPLRSSKDFPATLGIATSGKDATIRLRLIALSKGTPVDVRDYKVEHIESSRIKLLEVYFSAACRPLVSIEDDEVTSTCSSGKTCDPETASCVSGTRDAVELPDYDGKDGGGEDGGDDGPDDTHPGTGGGGGMVEDELDPACSGRAAGDAYCAEDERYRCGDDLLLAQTTLDPCENGRCVEASGEAHCVSSCGFNNGGCADGIECIDTPEGARCAGCAEDEFSPSGDGTDCRPRVVCEPGTYVTDPGSASTDRKCAPCKKETFSSSVNQIFWPCSLVRSRRNSLMSILECSSHLRHASADTSSNTRWPTGPLRGGFSRPGASRPNFTQCTMRDIATAASASGEEAQTSCFAARPGALRGSASIAAPVVRKGRSG